MIYLRRSIIVSIFYAVLQNGWHTIAEPTLLRRGVALEDPMERHLQDEFYFSLSIVPFLANNSCISNDRQLRDAVALAPNPTDPKSKPLLINVCRALVLIDPTKKTKGVTGIDLSNRYIDMRCKIATSARERCKLNAQAQSRIFYGNNTKLIVTGVDFINASVARTDPLKMGGALMFGKKSNITLNQAFLLNNKGSEGVGIAVEDSTLFMKGNADANKLIVSGNTGSVVKLKLSTAKMIDVKFVSNTVDLGAIKSDRSKVSLMNCTFYRNNDEEVGSDISIVDNTDPKLGGTFVSCDGTKNTFCDGLGNLAIDNRPNINNTNCKTKGIVGKPGFGYCVL